MANSDFEQLLGTIRVLNQQLDQLKTTIGQFSREFRQTGSEDFSRALAQQRLLAEQLANQLANATNQYNRMKEAAKQAATNTIPGGYEEGADEGGRFSKNRFKRGYGTPLGSQGKRDPNDRGVGGRSAYDAAEKAETEIQRIERERIETLRATLASEKRYEAAVKLAEKQGFTLDNLKNVRTRGTGNINQLQFEKYNELGIKQNLDIFTNQNGRATPGISNQFRTFGQGIVRDIGELTKWSIALAAVYGPLRKLGDLSQEMIENQTRLADATITVNNAFTGQAEIFDISADAAQRSGEAISGVIDAFTQAYRATGGVGDNVTRLTTAQKLLSDSLILSKLSTLDQAQSIDVLAAAVRQSGGDFNKTTELLDSWVRVTKVANVDLATLATGFATVGDAAANVGLDVNELNGILAVLAESTNQTGQEVANTSRAIIAGFQSDQGIRALEALGIATKDAEGNMRSLKDVIQEVASLRKQGAINDTAFASLTLDIGGGSRRQAPTATFLENYDRAIEVATESARAGGDAQAALDKQLATVQTDITKLANAFTTLAQTMGGEGGFLSIIQGGVQSMTSLVGVFDKLVSLLGKATPAMAAFIAASLVLKQQGRGGIQEALFGAGQLAGPNNTPYEILGRLNQVSGNNVPIRRTESDKFRGFGQEVLGKGGIGGIFQGLALSAIPAILNATNKSDRFGGVKAGADVLGGITGGIVGALVAGSPIIGASIGTAIAEAFVNSTIARKTDIFGYSGSAALNAPGVTPGQAGKTPEDRLRDAEANLYKSIGFGNESVGRFLTTDIQKRQESVFTNLNKAIQDRDKDTFESLLKGYGGATKNITGLSPEQLRGAFANNQQLTPNTQVSAYNRASEDARKQYDAALSAYKATQTGTAEIDTPFTRMVAQNQETFGDLIAQVKESSKGRLQQQRLTGDVTGADYARKSTALGGFDTKALQYYTALGQTFIDMNKDVDDATGAFEAFNTVITSGAEDSVPEITAIVGEIQKLINILNDPKLQTTDALKTLGFDNLDEVKTKLKDLQQTGSAVLSDIYNQTRLNNLKIPDIQGDFQKPLQKNEFEYAKGEAVKLQNQFYQGFLKIPDQMYEGLKKSWADFAQVVEDSGDKFYEKVSGIDPKFMQQAIAEGIANGQITSQQKNAFGIQQLDITSGQGANLQGTIDYYTKYLSSNFPQYEQKPEEFGVIFSDYVTDVLHGDNLAVKLALEKILDVNQKQLDGMYNIPEGATFWVPLQAAYYRPKEQGGGGLDIASVDSNTDATDENTAATNALKEAMMQRKSEEAGYGVGARAGGAERFRRIEGRVQNIRLDDPNSVGGILASQSTLSRKSEEAGYGVGGGQTGGQTASWFEQIINSVKNAVGQLQQFTSPGRYGQAFQSELAGGRFNDRGGAAAAAAPTTVSARLDLRFDNNTQLIVDGRVLASIITPYLASDLIKLEASQGTITKRYVI